MADYHPSIIDCGNITNLTTEQNSLVDFSINFGNLLKKDGSLYLTNHGVSPQTVQTFFDKSKDFFNLPAETKAKYKADMFSSNSFGFVPTGIERAVESENPTKRSNALTKREGFVFAPVEAQNEANYPSEIPNWQPVVQEVFESLSKLIKILLRAIAIYLELEDEEYFLKAHRSLEKNTIHSHTNLRSSFYFPLDPSAQIPLDVETFRLLTHCDWGMLTFLFQDDAGGLEYMMSNGEWNPVNPIQNSIVLQVGQTLEMWTGGHFQAVPHRVRLTKENARTCRQSFALFLHPDGDTKCSPPIPWKENWTPPFSNIGEFTHDEFIQQRRKRATVKE